MDNKNEKNLINSDADIEAIAKIKCALATDMADVSDEEIEVEWKEFETKHFKPKDNNVVSLGRSWLKVAAVLVGIVMITCAAFAFIHIYNVHQQDTSQNLPIENNETAVPNVNNEMADTTTTTQPNDGDIVEFDDVELNVMLEQMATHYHLKLKYENEQSRHIRLFFKWNTNADIASIVKILNNYNRISMELSGDTLIVK